MRANWRDGWPKGGLGGNLLMALRRKGTGNTFEREILIKLLLAKMFRQKSALCSSKKNKKNIVREANRLMFYDF